jgi:hypothetical protein
MKQADIEFSDSCEKLVNEIQKGEYMPWQYALMVMVFVNAQEDGETNRMALALAKNALNDMIQTDLNET